MLGYTREELLQLGVEDLVPVPMRRDHAALRRDSRLAPGQGRMMGAERRRLAALRKDGTTVTVEISLSPLESEEGPLVVAALRDVTERIRVEEERARIEDHLRQAQRLESLGMLAGGIAHDFNNLLGAILANAELATAAVPKSGVAAESLAEITTASNRAAELVTQILAFSRKQPASRSVTSVHGVVLEVTRLLRATIPAGIEVVCEVVGEKPMALLDATQVHQVLMNLGTNAWHAIERTTGTISVQGRLDPRQSEHRRPRRAAARPVRAYPGHRRRQGDGPRHARAHLRAVLHDQGDWKGDGPRAGDGAWHRRGARRRRHGGERAGPRVDLLRVPSRGAGASRRSAAARPVEPARRGARAARGGRARAAARGDASARARGLPRDRL